MINKDNQKGEVPRDKAHEMRETRKSLVQLGSFISINFATTSVHSHKFFIYSSVKKGQNTISPQTLF